MQKIIHFIKSVFLRKAFFIHATEYVQVFDVSLLLLREILDFNVKRLSGSVQTYATETEERCDIPTNQLVEILVTSCEHLCIALARKAESLGILTFRQQLLNYHLFTIVPMLEGRNVVFLK